VVGNDDSDPTDEVPTDPYTNGGKLHSDDVPSRMLSDSTGNEGNSIEFKLYFREFARLQLGNTWFRISDFYPWRADFKLKKVNTGTSRGPIWKDDGSILATDNTGL
jgi:hypothetical protein